MPIETWDTMLEGFTTVEYLINMSNYFLELNMPAAIHNRLMCLLPLPHFTFCRGENVRTLQFPGLFHLKLESEGYSVCYAIVAVMSQGKRTSMAGKSLLFLGIKRLLFVSWVHWLFISLLCFTY